MQLGTRQRYAIIAGLAVVIAAGLMFVNAQAPTSPTGQSGGGEDLEPLRIGHVPGLLTSPHYTAIEEGFYREEGFDASMVELPGPEINKALVNGRIEVGSGATTPANYQIASDVPVRFVAARAQYTPDQAGASLAVRSDLNITSVEELEGKTICSSTSGSMGELWIQVWADRVGLEHGEDYEFTYLGDETSYMSAFSSDSVDACFTDSSTPMDLLRMEGLAYEFDSFSRSGIISAFAAVRQDWVEEEPEKVRRFLRAYAKAAKYARNHPQERLQNVAKHSPYTVDQLEDMTKPGVPQDLRINQTKIEIGQDLMVRYGQLDEHHNVSPYVVNRFVADVQQDIEGIDPAG